MSDVEAFMNRRKALTDYFEFKASDILSPPEVVCLTCGSRVDDSFAEVHLQWHRAGRVNRPITRAQVLQAQLAERNRTASS